MYEIAYQVINIDNAQPSSTVVFDNSTPVERTYVEGYFSIYPNLLYINHQEKQVVLGSIGRVQEFPLPCPIPLEQLQLLAPYHDHFVLIDDDFIYGLTLNEDGSSEVIHYPYLEGKRFVRNKLSCVCGTLETLDNIFLTKTRFKKLIKIS